MDTSERKNMNKLFMFLFFVAGVGVGSFATWRFVDEKYKKIADEEISSVKEVFSQMSDKPKSNGNKTTEWAPAPEKDGDCTHTNMQYGHGNYEERPAIDYTKYSSGIEDGPPEDDPELDYPHKNVAPYVISAQSFINEKLEYEKLTITYYEGDDTLADDAEEIVDDPVSLAGEGVFEKFGTCGSEDPNVVYVRNERIGTDFEILLNKGAYSEEVIRPV